MHQLFRSAQRSSVVSAAHAEVSIALGDPVSCDLAQSVNTSSGIDAVVLCYAITNATLLQAAIVSLATHVLQHPDTLNEVNKLAKDVIALLVKGTNCFDY
jgi:hypothetical protein